MSDQRPKTTRIAGPHVLDVRCAEPNRRKGLLGCQARNNEMRWLWESVPALVVCPAALYIFATGDPTENLMGFICTGQGTDLGASDGVDLGKGRKDLLLHQSHGKKIRWKVGTLLRTVRLICCHAGRD